MATFNDDVTGLLRAWAAGNEGARDRLIPIVYKELRRRAAVHLRAERHAHTLQPTALVHEAYLRLIDQRRAAWQDRGHFFCVASQVMRRILVDRARARLARKRPTAGVRIDLDSELPALPASDVELLDLDRALSRLAAFDTRKSQVAELQFFGGLSLQEAATTLGISRSTAERDWQAARAWLFNELTRNPS